MWGCCASRDPKKNKFLVANEKSEWISATKEVAAPADTEVEVEVAYVALNSSDNASIKSFKGIGQSFSGTVKAVGAKIDAKDFAKGDKVFGIYKGADGAISDFIVVPSASIAKITGSVDLKTAAALPQISQVASQLNTTLAADKKVTFSGPKGGLYESIFTSVAKKNKAVVQPTADTLVDFLFHSEGGVVTGVKPENYAQAWSIESVTHGTFLENKKFAGVSTAADLTATSKFAQDALNSDILKNIKWSNDEVVTNAAGLKAALTKLAGTAHGPILIDIDVLKDLPKKEEPKPVVVTPPTDTSKTAGQTTATVAK